MSTASENTIHVDLLELVKQECHKINDYCKDSIGVHKDGKYTTFWLNKDETPETLIEYIVKQISYQDFPNGFPEDYIGMEWWTQVRDTKEGITFHYDKDEALCSEKNIYNYPLKSTVTYLTDIGGPTAIFNDNNYNRGYLSFPKVNKHIIFDGHLFHGVMGPLSKEIPTNDKKRITLLINYWTYQPAGPNCIVFPEKEKLLPLERKHQVLQNSAILEKSKIIKMNYGKGTNDWIIYRSQVPINITFAKTLKQGYTYSFQFLKSCVVF